MIDSDSSNGTAKGRDAVEIDSSGRRVLPWNSIVDETPTQKLKHNPAPSIPPASSRPGSVGSNRPLISSSPQSSPKPRNVLLKKNSSRRKAGKRGSAQSLQAQSAYKAPRGSDQANPISQSQSETPERWSMIDVPLNVGHMGMSVHEHRQSMDGTNESGDSEYSDAQTHAPLAASLVSQPTTLPATTTAPLADSENAGPHLAEMLALGKPMLSTSGALDLISDTGYAALALREGQTGRRGLVVPNSQALTSMHGSVGFAGQSVLSLASAERPRQISGPEHAQQRRSIDRPRRTSGLGLSDVQSAHSRNASGQEWRRPEVVVMDRRRSMEAGAQEVGPGELGRLMRERSRKESIELPLTDPPATFVDTTVPAPRTDPVESDPQAATLPVDASNPPEKEVVSDSKGKGKASIGQKFEEKVKGGTFARLLRSGAASKPENTDTSTMTSMVDASAIMAGDIDPSKSASEYGRSNSTYETAPSQASNTSRGRGASGSARTQISLGKKS